MNDQPPPTKAEIERQAKEAANGSDNSGFVQFGYALESYASLRFEYMLLAARLKRLQEQLEDD